jgi:hypothetical protein
MSRLACLVVVALASPVHAEDFDGKWKVPDAQTLNAGKCKGGDQKECLRLAWTAEAGVRSAGDTDVKRLESARDWHDKACAIAKQKPCANAERVTKKLEAAKALKSDGEFWCVDALDGAKRFADGSRTAGVVVRGACKKLLPAKFVKSLDAIATASGDMKAEMMIAAAQESLCPPLKTRPAACTAKGVAADKRADTLAQMLKASLSGDPAARADELAAWLLK